MGTSARQLGSRKCASCPECAAGRLLWRVSYEWHYITPLMRLRDPAATKVLLITLAETTRCFDTRSC